jgi:hypothetical protein
MVDFKCAIGKPDFLEINKSTGADCFAQKTHL